MLSDGTPGVRRRVPKSWYRTLSRNERKKDGRRSMGRRADHIDVETLRVLAGIEDMDDPRKAWAAVKGRIEALRRAGKDVPEALVIAERQLMCELMAESQGR